MVGEAHLLLGDVEFLDVEDHLLLQPVGIDIDLQLGHSVEDAGADCLGAGLLEGHDLLLVVLDQVDAAQQVGDQRGALLLAEGVEAGAGRLDGRHERRQLLLAHRLRFSRYHVGQTQDALQRSALPPCGGGLEPGGLRRVAQLRGIGGECLPVDVGRGLRALRFDRHERIDLAAHQRAGQCPADVVLGLSVDGRQAQVEVELLGVERTELHRYFLGSESGFGLTEARHGFDHGLSTLTATKLIKTNQKGEASPRQVKIIRGGFVCMKILPIFVLVN